MQVIGDFTDTMMSCMTCDAVGEAVARELARHGYSSSACSASVQTADGPQPQFYFRNWTPAWTAVSVDRQHGRTPLIAREARRRGSAFTWRDIPRQRALSTDEQTVLRTAHEFGWLDGLVVPIHGPLGYVAVFGMATAEADVDPSTAANLRLAMIAYAAHQRCRDLSPPSQTESVNLLSPRELECLRWVARGKTDKEIGIILSLSPDTVKFYIERARQRLTSTTRAQAVAHLALCGKL